MKLWKIVKFILLAFMVYIIMQALNGGFCAYIEWCKTTTKDVILSQNIHTAVCSIVLAAIIAVKIKEYNARINK